METGGQYGDNLVVRLTSMESGQEHMTIILVVMRDFCTWGMATGSTTPLTALVLAVTVRYCVQQKKKICNLSQIMKSQIYFRSSPYRWGFCLNLWFSGDICYHTQCILVKSRSVETWLSPSRGSRGSTNRGLEVDVDQRGQPLVCGHLVWIQPHVGLQWSICAQQTEK